MFNVGDIVTRSDGFLEGREAVVTHVKGRLIEIKWLRDGEYGPSYVYAPSSLRLLSPSASAGPDRIEELFA